MARNNFRKVMNKALHILKIKLILLIGYIINCYRWKSANEKYRHSK
jgi:hypothetical protein